MNVDYGNLVIERMQDYDGNGWLCYLPNGENTGFGDTQGDAFNSWQNGEDIGEAAWAKWHAVGVV